MSIAIHLENGQESFSFLDFTKLETSIYIMVVKKSNPGYYHKKTEIKNHQQLIQLFRKIKFDQVNKVSCMLKNEKVQFTIASFNTQTQV